VLGEKQVIFKDRRIKELKWGLDGDVDKMWIEIASCIKRVAKEQHVKSKGCRLPNKETW
jgi:hypothetical protein